MPNVAWVPRTTLCKTYCQLLKLLVVSGSPNNVETSSKTFKSNILLKQIIFLIIICGVKSAKHHLTKNLSNDNNVRSSPMTCTPQDGRLLRTYTVLLLLVYRLGQRSSRVRNRTALTKQKLVKLR